MDSFTACEWWQYAQYLVFFLLGMLVSFINSIAGGGSTISLPLLIFLGLPPTIANGTNRIGLIVGNISSVTNLAKHGYLNKKIFFQLLIPTIIGSAIGIFFLTQIGDRLFQAILACVLCFVVIISNLRRDILGKPPKSPPQKLTWKGAIGFSIVAIYGCIVQVGVGLVQIFSLTRYTGLDLVHVNALKNALTTVFLVFSTIALGIAGKINWPIAITLAVGAWCGGYCGSFLQRKKGNKFIRIFICLTSIVMAIQLVIDLI